MLCTDRAEQRRLLRPPEHFEGTGTDCSTNLDCGLPESCLGTKCLVPYCADDCPAAAAEPVATDSQIGTCSQQ